MSPEIINRRLWYYVVLSSFSPSRQRENIKYIGNTI